MRKGSCSQCANVANKETEQLRPKETLTALPTLDEGCMNQWRPWEMGFRLELAAFEVK